MQSHASAFRFATLLGEPVTGVGAFSWKESEFAFFARRDRRRRLRHATVSAGCTEPSTSSPSSLGESLADPSTVPPQAIKAHNITMGEQ